MNLNILLMALLAVLAAVWLVRPFWQSLLPAAQRRRAANVAAYRGRLAEIEAEQAAGLLSPEAVAALHAELDARLLGDTDAAEPGSQAAPRRVGAALLLALLFGVSGAAWYWQAGSWRLADQIAQARSAPTGIPQPPDVLAMVAKLETRLQAQPDDAEGWAMLGRSYFVMERYPDASRAYARANELSDGGNPAWLTNEGEALTLARDRDLLGRPQQLFEAALKLAPDDGKTLWYAGLASAAAGEFGPARSRFERLLTQELPPEIRSAVQSRLEEIASLQGEPPVAAVPAAAAPRPAAVAQTGVQLLLDIELDPALLAKRPAGAVLMVFAKAADGPPMPLAVQRLPGATLPLRVVLDDSMAMTPAMRLSQFDRWVVTARLSQSGGAQVSPGDLQGSLTLGAEAAGEPQTLVIRERVGG